MGFKGFERRSGREKLKPFRKEAVEVNFYLVLIIFNRVKFMFWSISDELIV